jgi:uncharacterized membrane protein
MNVVHISELVVIFMKTVESFYIKNQIFSLKYKLAVLHNLTSLSEVII